MYKIINSFKRRLLWLPDVGVIIQWEYIFAFLIIFYAFGEFILEPQFVNADDFTIVEVVGDIYNRSGMFGVEAVEEGYKIGESFRFDAIFKKQHDVKERQPEQTHSLRGFLFLDGVRYNFFVHALANEKAENHPTNPESPGDKTCYESIGHNYVLLFSMIISGIIGLLIGWVICVFIIGPHLYPPNGMHKGRQTHGATNYEIPPDIMRGTDLEKPPRCLPSL